MRLAAFWVVFFASAAIAADADILLRRKAKAHDSIESISVFDQSVLERHLLREKKPEQAKEEKESVLVPPDLQVFMYTAEWCGLCQEVAAGFPWLRKSGWKIGTGRADHIVIMDETTAASGVVAEYPTFVFKWRGKEIKRKVLKSAREVMIEYNKTVDSYTDTPQ